jgi:hypothetical protein
MKNPLLIALLLIGLFCIPFAKAENNFYSAPKFSFGYALANQNSAMDSIRVNYIYRCYPLYRTDKQSTVVPLFNATGHSPEEFGPEDYMPYLDDYVANTFSDKPGDAVMILCDENKYWALIKSIGVLNDACLGFTPVCNLAVIDSMPQTDNMNFVNLIALRKGAFYDGQLYKIKTDSTIQYYIDSLKNSFTELAADSSARDSIIVETYMVNSTNNSTIVSFYHLRYEELFNSALYEIVKDGELLKVITFFDPVMGTRSWKFNSAFDLDHDGNLEYFISIFGWEEETLSIFTFRNGEWIPLYSVTYGGC